MKQFKISFWYGTDCRWETSVGASNEITALGLALDLLPHAIGCFWVVERPFAIKIEIA